MNIRAWVFDLGLGSGSGLAMVVSEPFGLLSFAIKYCAMSWIYLNHCAQACLGFQKSPRALKQFRPGQLTGIVPCRALMLK